MESAWYRIFTLAGEVSEISLVPCAHSFDFRYCTNSCENPVRARFPWSYLYFHIGFIISVLADKCHSRKIKLLLVLRFFTILLNKYINRLTKQQNYYACSDWSKLYSSLYSFLNSFLHYYSRDEWKEKTNLDHRIKNHIFSWNSLRILTLIVFSKQQTATARDFQAFSRVFLISRAGLLRRSRG